MMRHEIQQYHMPSRPGDPAEFRDRPKRIPEEMEHHHAEGGIDAASFERQLEGIAQSKIDVSDALFLGQKAGASDHLPGQIDPDDLPGDACELKSQAAGAATHIRQHEVARQ